MRDHAIDLPNAFDRADAEHLADISLRILIPVLQASESEPRSFNDWALRLANARARLADAIYDRLAGYVDREDILRRLRWGGLDV
jgi:hypothetical protein